MFEGDCGRKIRVYHIAFTDWCHGGSANCLGLKLKIFLIFGPGQISYFFDIRLFLVEYSATIHSMAERLDKPRK